MLSGGKHAARKRSRQHDADALSGGAGSVGMGLRDRPARDYEEDLRSACRPPSSTQTSFRITKPLRIGEPSLDPSENTIDTELKSIECSFQAGTSRVPRGMRIAETNPQETFAFQ
jgi:hypothetical protein